MRKLGKTGPQSKGYFDRIEGQRLANKTNRIRVRWDNQNREL